jgi:hypothetical protein
MSTNKEQELDEKQIEVLCDNAYKITFRCCATWHADGNVSASSIPIVKAVKILSEIAGWIITRGDSPDYVIHTFNLGMIYYKGVRAKIGGQYEVLVNPNIEKAYDYFRVVERYRRSLPVHQEMMLKWMLPKVQYLCDEKLLQIKFKVLRDALNGTPNSSKLDSMLLDSIQHGL